MMNLKALGYFFKMHTENVRTCSVIGEVSDLRTVAYNCSWYFFMERIVSVFYAFNPG